QGVAVDAANNLYVVDETAALLKVAPGEPAEPLTSSNCGSGFRGPGLCAPEGIAVDPAGGVFVADGYCRIRYQSPDGGMVTVAGMDARPSHGFAFTCGDQGDGAPALESSFAWPFAVALDGNGNLFIADTYNNCIRKLDSEGIVTTFAGRCGEAGFG